MKILPFEIAALLLVAAPLLTASEQTPANNGVNNNYPKDLAQAFYEASHEEQNNALDALKVVHVSGTTECDEDIRVDSQMFVSVEFEGRIADESETGEPGTVFDSSAHRGGLPLDFQHSLGQVPLGLDIGTRGLCQGSSATITIPPLLGFGKKGNGGLIPGDATITISVLVKKVAKEDWRQHYDYFLHMDRDNNNLVSKEEMKAFMLKYYRHELSDELWDSADKNGDGHCDWDEFPLDKGPKPQRKESDDDL